MDQNNSDNVKIDIGSQVQYSTSAGDSTVSGAPQKQDIEQIRMDASSMKWKILFVVVAAIVTVLIIVLSGDKDIPPEALKNPDYGMPIVD
ncbi:MAG: hypothetical protein COW88_00045 [Candidatus Lloydbacteria bacterium CG22_combo_CG10-13_8_21_14_all_47_15]|uniref:Uncharacterized protein n=1 Tax=Candidatus Lloydbacteria bacterium CG22_combo_CG10-13_8_21_14_all_47_15 TaxID=1974635 RepID=A0A2H0CVJ5_9BACT|nr:MAG: hypothetical protein COW88_00045 [Candidatus Lloydbacteria bacterium CG22_combo_CG10-13_8_21_14_all_47_15]